jgi:DNA invertase Pin-like site-specific DNA recombinase
MNKITQQTVNQSDKRCVVYYRCSTDEQETQRQELECLAECEKRGLVVSKIFQEHKSGRNRNRQEMTNCLNYIKENNIHRLLLSEISRISRSLEGGSILDQLTQQKVCIIALKEEIQTLNDDFSENRNHIYLASNAVSNAIKESDYLSYRVKGGRRTKVIYKGGWTGGKFLPYGYTSINGILTVDQNEAIIVKQIFKRYLEGWGAIKISNALNNERNGNGIPTKLGAKWQRSTINQLLPHTIYIGKRMFDGKQLDTPDLRIIDDQTFFAAQKRMKERKNTDITFNQLKKYDYMFDKGLIKCGVCGKNYHGAMRKDSTDGVYKCISTKYHKGCGNHSVRIRWIEETVSSELHNNWFTLLQDNTALHALTEKLQLELKLLQAEQQRGHKLKNKYNEMYALDRIDRIEYDKRYNQSQDIILKAQERINTIQVQLQANITLKRTVSMQIHEYNEKTGEAQLIHTGIDKETLHKVIKQINVIVRDAKQVIEVCLINGNKFTINK